MVPPGDFDADHHGQRPHHGHDALPARACQCVMAAEKDEEERGHVDVDRVHYEQQDSTEHYRRRHREGNPYPDKVQDEWCRSRQRQKQRPPRRKQRVALGGDRDDQRQRDRGFPDTSKRRERVVVGLRLGGELALGHGGGHGWLSVGRCGVSGRPVGGTCDGRHG